jgi:hypothetical protein
VAAAVALASWAAVGVYGIPCKTKISNSKYQVQMSNIKFKFISQVQKQNIKFKPKNIKFI